MRGVATVMYDRCEPTEIRPARFNGQSAAGEMLWNLLAVDSSSDWPVLWVGEEIEVPIPARCAALQI